MYVYKQLNNIWVVGFYDAIGAWCPESEWDHPEKAAARVNYLNGGTGQVHRRQI